jgi:hypothetical protein
MRRRARTVLCGGRSAMIVPTATAKTSEKLSRGIVAKLAHGTYGKRWYKIRNPDYSQYEGRRELFEKRSAYRSSPSSGLWLAHRSSWVSWD